MGKWRAPHPAKKSVTIMCPCGGTFETQQWRINQGKGKYCSRTCYSINTRNADGVEVDGIWFSRSGGNEYYWAKVEGASRSLHKHIWESSNGTTPRGYQIHHIDGNPANNKIGNLECILASDHARMHLAERIANGTLDAVKSLELAREAAKVWHKSPEGRDWHRRNALEHPATRETEEYVCSICGSKYERAKREYMRHNCSPACYQKQLRRERKGIQHNHG